MEKHDLFLRQGVFALLSGGTGITDPGYSATAQESVIDRGK
jgi:hypothetical protein